MKGELDGIVRGSREVVASYIGKLNKEKKNMKERKKGSKNEGSTIFRFLLPLPLLHATLGEVGVACQSRSSSSTKFYSTISASFASLFFARDVFKKKIILKHSSYSITNMCCSITSNYSQPRREMGYRV